MLAHLLCLRSDWSEKDARNHLNTFLFRKNEEVQKCASCLSGGEKARLSLALIAAKLPRLLILDEITNNLDLETKEHVEQVLIHYPGAMIVVSHDDAFVETLGVDATYEIKEGQFFLVKMA